jgi:hypothetical protein
MGALNIAFDTTIVGALALSWVVLVIHLFFLDDEGDIKEAIDWIKDKGLTTVAGVLLFAAAFALGSGVSRLAADFFNDDDLRVDTLDHRFRVGVTTDGIRTRVYCENQKLLDALRDSRTTELGGALKADSWLCQNALAWSLPAPSEKDEKDKKDTDLVPHVFYLQESAIQLNGEDKTERVRQLHDQVFVLRGAAFNGMVAFTLCLFAWGTEWGSKLRWILPVAVLVPTSIALYHHLGERPIADPPFMEFTLLLLTASGAYLLWKGPRLEKDEDEEKRFARRKIRLGLVMLSLVLAFAAFLAWWSTETLYCQLVIDTYYAQAQQLPK